MIDYSWIKEMLRERKLDDRLFVNDVKKVYDKLIEVARKGRQNNKEGIIFYEDIMLIAGLHRENPADREIVLSNMLWGISDFEQLSGKPLLSAIVVRKDTHKP